MGERSVRLPSPTVSRSHTLALSHLVGLSLQPVSGGSGSQPRLGQSSCSTFTRISSLHSLQQPCEEGFVVHTLPMRLKWLT